MMGTTLSHYRVLEKLGAGGMGEVYRAEDTTLGRHVAIKILPDVFRQDAERLARFAREAKTLASLNHPNIAAIYGLEEAAGRRLLVMELVEGETLAQRISRGPLPVKEALEVCRQIAEGLEAAHEKGIIHRDLKPSNVKVTAEGKVKILDFGLAKAFHEQPSGAATEESPTITDTMTRPGVLLGTAAYMAPEQAKGKGVDKRVDVWAFGCVWYECLTGKRAFRGESITEVLARILESEPDWEALPLATPGKMRDLVQRCLRKDPRDRIHDMADARIELQDQRTLPGEPAPAPPRLSRGALTAAGLAAVGLGLLIGVGAMKYLQSGAAPGTQPVVRSLVRLESGHWLDGLRRSPPYGLENPTRTAMALSRDGRFVVYGTVKENPGAQDKPRLSFRRFDQLEAKPIVGTEGGSCPFLSPDDRWIGFWADGKLMKVPVEGGVPAVLCEMPWPFGCCWGADNQILFASWESGLSRISAAGGKIEDLTKPDPSREESAHRLPCDLPGGRGILITIMRHGWDPRPRVAVLELATRRWRVLLENAADARYVATGHLAFLRQGTLLVVPFDLERLEVTGQPVPAVANVAQALNMTDSRHDTAAGQFSVSASGSLVYALGGIAADMQNSLVWVDRAGKAETIASFRAPFFAPRLSPDGQRIAYVTHGLEKYVWLYDLKRGTATKLTSEGVALFTAWSPDGRRVAFDWVKSGVLDLHWQAADGGSPMELLTQSEHRRNPGSWSPDGETLAFVEQRPETGFDILLLNLHDRKVTPYLNSRFEERQPEFSPDGKWLAYVSDESGRPEVYVQPFPAGGARWQISNDGGEQPLWGRNGKQFFYRGPGLQTTQVWVVEVETGAGLSASKPKLLFDQPGYGSGFPVRGWDISADGDRFLMVKLEERKPQPLTEMVLVQNWFEEVRRLAPTRE